MRRTALVGVGLIGMLFFVDTAVNGAVGVRQENIFLKLGPIRGKAETKGYQDQIVIDRISYGITQKGAWTEGNAPGQRVTTFGDITFVKEMDNSSPSLAYACSVKDQFPRAEVALVAAGKETYFKIILENVMVTSVAVEFEAGWVRPKEVFTVSYQKATWEWGTAKAGYDLKQNVGR